MKESVQHHGTGSRHKSGHGHGSRFLETDQYAVRSGLSGVNPDLKVLTGMMFLILCIMSHRGIASVFIGCGMVGLTLEKGKISWREYTCFLRIPLSFLLLSGIVLLVDISGHRMGMVDIPIGRWYLSVTEMSVRTAFLITIRALAGITCLYMISLSTPLYEIIGVLRRMHVPQIMIELMYLMYRFIFILLESYDHMKTAAQTRMGFSGIRRAYISFFGICTNLLVVAFGKASKSFDAMESRGYDGQLMFLERKKQVTGKQAAVAVVYLAAAVVILLAERRLG